MNERSTISAGISVFVGEVSSVYFSLNLRPPREFSLGFGNIKACFWRRTKLLPEVFPVCVRKKLFLGKYFPHPPAFQSFLWKRVPPVSFLSGLVPSRYLFVAVAVYYRGSLQYSIVQRLFLGKSFPLSEARPPREFLSGSVPSMHRFGVVAVYY